MGVSLKDNYVDDEIETFLKNSKNANTWYTSNTGCNRLIKFIKKHHPNETRDFTEFSAPERGVNHSKKYSYVFQKIPSKNSKISKNPKNLPWKNSKIS